jgi:tRNA nucleotidyltransferase (CCA-adding enzyme)
MQQLGLAPGKQLGLLLEQLLERVTDQPELNTPELLLSEARALVAAG